MILYKLIGFNEVTGIFTNPSTGQVENLPSPPFVISDSLPADYSLFDAPENWADYAQDLIGSVFGLQDYLSFRYQIYTRIEAICGTDYANWNLLTAEQKQVALVWCNIRIINARGIVFYIAECGGQAIANEYIENYFNYSMVARIKRYDNAFTIYGYTYLGKLQGIKAESYERQDLLDSTYIQRGVVFLADDGIDGLGDWILGLNIYSVTGLKPRIISGEFVLQYGMVVDTFCDTLVGIINNGTY